MQTRESWSTPACSAYGKKKTRMRYTVRCVVSPKRDFWWPTGWQKRVVATRCSAPCGYNGLFDGFWAGQRMSGSRGALRRVAHTDKKKHECDTRWSATAHLFLHRGGWRHGNYNPTSSHRNLNVNRNGIRSCRTIWTSQQCEQLVQIHAPPPLPNGNASSQLPTQCRLCRNHQTIGFRKSDRKLDLGFGNRI